VTHDECFSHKIIYEYRINISIAKR